MDWRAHKDEFEAMKPEIIEGAFMYIFAGVGNLTKAVKATGVMTM